jgi:hypothetical protein
MNDSKTLEKDLFRTWSFKVGRQLSSLLSLTTAFIGCLMTTSSAISSIQTNTRKYRWGGAALIQSRNGYFQASITLQLQFGRIFSWKRQAICHIGWAEMETVVICTFIFKTSMKRQRGWNCSIWFSLESIWADCAHTCSLDHRESITKLLSTTVLALFSFCIRTYPTCGSSVWWSFLLTTYQILCFLSVVVIE